MTEAKPVIICAIAKNEHLYINDWVKYHIDLGFDHIYIFDNDDIESDFIGNYVDKEFLKNISFINVRGIRRQWFQQECYNAFYQQERENFSWCAFIDIDEYIVLNDWHNIKEMVNDKRFDDFYSIKLRWHLYGDDDVIKRDISESPFLFFKKWLKKHDYNSRGKQITRGGLDRANIHAHNCFINDQIIKQCTAAAVPCFGENYAFDTNGSLCDNAFINHYMTKTLDEFLNQKLNKTDVMFKNKNTSMEYYWKVNAATPEKIKYIEQYLETKR